MWSLVIMFFMNSQMRQVQIQSFNDQTTCQEALTELHLDDDLGLKNGYDSNGQVVAVCIPKQ